MKKHHDIIHSIAAGDRQAFKLLYIEYAEVVYNTALSYTKNVEEAEEVTQDVFTKVFQNASKFKGNSTVKTWIYRITVNTSLNYIKSKKRFSLFNFNSKSEHNIDFEHPGVLLENKENAKILFQVIDSLPDTQKTAFILSYIEDLPRQDVADIMETSLKAVESLLQRAKKKMRIELEKTFPHRRKKSK